MNTKWNQIEWKPIESYIWNMQTRIYKASLLGRTAEVHHQQDILINSKAAKLKAVRKVTQDNRGKKTSGVDGVDSLTPIAREELAKTLKLDGLASPNRRVWIPKPGTNELLGIPTLSDRAKQALATMALEPEWEAKFEGNSYGFRPGRCCQDAIEAIYLSINQKPKYVLDADIGKCFDQINVCPKQEQDKGTLFHEALLAKLNTFTVMHKQIKAWLKAGILEGPELFSEMAARRNEVISPLLSNIALHGIEEMLYKYVEERTVRDLRGKVLKKTAKRSQLLYVRYADDFVILHPEEKVIQECKNLVEEWLKSMGLELKASKTRIGHTYHPIGTASKDAITGFDFLGFNIRQYEISQYKVRKNKLSLPFRTLIKPERKTTLLHIKQLARIIDGTQNIEALIAKINPIITGWNRYYRSVVSYRVFKWCDTWLYKKLFRWACKKHPKQPRTWIREKYFLSKGNRNWVFAYNTTIKGKSEMISIIQHTALPIERHVKVQGKRSPYDGDWTYWGNRLEKYGTLSNERCKLLKKQKGKCGWCNLSFLPTDVVERDHVIPLSKGGTNTLQNLQLLHGHCHDEKTVADR